MPTSLSKTLISIITCMKGNNDVFLHFKIRLKNPWAETKATTVQQPQIIFANSFSCVDNPYMVRTHHFTTL